MKFLQHTQLPSGYSQSAGVRFFTKIRVADNGCWNWVGAKNKAGYGLMMRGTSKAHLCLAHRLSVLLTGRALCNADVVRHLCDNPACVNPFHLRVGTHADNVMDAVEKRRHAYGEKNGRRKLTFQDVLKIRKDSRSSFEIAESYGVSERHVRKIVAGTTWRLALKNWRTDAKA